MHVAVDTPRPTHLNNDKKNYFWQIYLFFWKNLCKYKSGLCAHGCPQGCGLGFYSDKNDSVAISPFDHTTFNHSCWIYAEDKLLPNLHPCLYILTCIFQHHIWYWTECILKSFYLIRHIFRLPCRNRAHTYFSQMKLSTILLAEGMPITTWKCSWIRKQSKLSAEVNEKCFHSLQYLIRMSLWSCFPPLSFGFAVSIYYFLFRQLFVLVFCANVSKVTHTGLEIGRLTTLLKIYKLWKYRNLRWLLVAGLKSHLQYWIKAYKNISPQIYLGMALCHRTDAVTFIVYVYCTILALTRKSLTLCGIKQFRKARNAHAAEIL